MQQISLIFHLIGAPNTRIWPEIEHLPLIRDLKIDLVEVNRYYYFISCHIYIGKVVLFHHSNKQSFHLVIFRQCLWI